MAIKDILKHDLVEFNMSSGVKHPASRPGFWVCPLFRRVRFPLPWRIQSEFWEAVRWEQR